MYLILKIGAGLYLLFLAVVLWRQAAGEIEAEQPRYQPLSLLAALRLGFLTQIANPKVIVFFGSIFVALLPAQSPLWVIAAALLIVFANETGWLAIVACVFSAPGSRRVYSRLKPWVDRATAGLLAVIGGKLIFEMEEHF